jgi:hypothetical protein
MALTDSNPSSRLEAQEKLDLRKRAHQKLDQALNLYLEGAPLWIRAEYGWTTPSLDHRLVLTIEDRFP